jgi:hypothetical protein
MGHTFGFAAGANDCQVKAIASRDRFHAAEERAVELGVTFLLYLRT